MHKMCILGHTNQDIALQKSLTKKRRFGGQCDPKFRNFAFKYNKEQVMVSWQNPHDPDGKKFMS